MNPHRFEHGFGPKLKKRRQGGARTDN